MMMKQVLNFFFTLTVFFAGSVNAANIVINPAIAKHSPAQDTTLTPTPAQAIITPINSDNQVEAILINQAVAAKIIKLNPRAVSFVQDYMTRNTKDLTNMKEWARPYFDMMEGIMVKNGLPVELKYLAVVESKLKATAKSHVGAVGPWQFMPATAIGMGLKVGKRKDERRDFVKSTNAAAKYLKYLYGEFGDWLLVIAAYNGGPGYVYNAIKKSGSRNFWLLQNYLPLESRNHVKKFISTHYIMEGTGGITTLTKAEATEQIASLAGYLLNRNLTAEELDNSTTTTISGKYRSIVIAKYVNMDIAEFNRYNPGFDKVLDEGTNGYSLRLPALPMELFVSNKYAILNQSVEMLLNGNYTAEAVVNKKSETTANK